MPIDPITMALIGGVGAAGSIAGGLTGSRGPDSADERLVFVTPESNPLQSGLQLDALLNLGLSGLTTTLQASPIEQAIAEINQNPTLNTKLKRRATAALSAAQNRLQESGNDFDAFRDEFISGQPGGDTTTQILFGLSNQHDVRKALGQAMAVTGLSGFGTLENLISSEAQFRQTEFERAEQNRGVEEEIRSGRLEGIRNISEILSDFPIATGERLAELRQAAIEEEQARVIEHANRFGFAPSASALSDAELRALERVNVGLSGEQSLGINAIEGIRRGLNPTGSAELATNLITSGRSSVLAANQAILGAQGLGDARNDAAASGVAGAGGAISDALLAFAGIEAQRENAQILADAVSRRSTDTPLSSPGLQGALGVIFPDMASRLSSR